MPGEEKKEAVPESNGKSEMVVYAALLRDSMGSSRRSNVQVVKSEGGR